MGRNVELCATTLPRSDPTTVARKPSLRPCGEDRDEHDQAEADHQRGGRGGGAGRVAHRVLAREPAGACRRAARAASRATRADGRTTKRASIATHDEHEQRADAHPEQPMPDAPDAGEALHDQQHADERRQDGEHRRVAREATAAAARRPRGARRSAGSSSRAAAGPSDATHGHADADDQGEHDRARRERRRLSSGCRCRARRRGRVDACGDADSRRRARAIDERRPITSASAVTAPQHLAPARAERPQHRELAQPLRDRDRERVEDDERADEHARSRRTRAAPASRKLSIALVDVSACVRGVLDSRSSTSSRGEPTAATHAVAAPAARRPASAATGSR